MGEAFSKIENFLFDILGLVLPGLIFIMLFVSPIFFLDISGIPKVNISNSYILSALTMLAPFLKNHLFSNSTPYLLITITIAYLLGHFVKVFSIILYDFMTVLFDRSINALVIYSFNKILLGINKIYLRVSRKEIYSSAIYLYLKTLFSPIRNTLIKIFTFKPPDYFSDNDVLKTNCINLINSRLGTNYPDKWYSLYKFSTIINSQEHIKSLAGNFLVKYNLYRSLSFIFAFYTIYITCFFSVSAQYISPELSKIASLFFITSFLFWFTFHYKFKRYWTLCGNETLVSLFYFLNKKGINET